MSKRRYMLSDTDANVLLLLHFENNYDDEKGHSISEVVNPSSLSFVPGQFGNALAGTAPNTNPSFIYYDLPYNPTNTKDFTVDFWMKTNAGVASNSSIRIGCKKNKYSQLNITIDTSGYVGLVCANNSLTDWVSFNFMRLASVPDDGMYHFVAVTIDDNNCKIFIDGFLRASQTMPIPPNSGEYFMISLDSYVRIDEVRLSSKIEWTSDFTPPIKPY